ncbi:hypothetical protein GJ496_009874 [Pomphorhynchus laevis]|nr:hypothetical protein GJ496_009874 [Pomphorhynchus laevis]
MNYCFTECRCLQFLPLRQFIEPIKAFNEQLASDSEDDPLPSVTKHNRKTKRTKKNKRKSQNGNKQVTNFEHSCNKSENAIEEESYRENNVCPDEPLNFKQPYDSSRDDPSNENVNLNDYDMGTLADQSKLDETEEGNGNELNKPKKKKNKRKRNKLSTYTDSVTVDDHKCLNHSDDDFNDYYDASLRYNPHVDNHLQIVEAINDEAVMVNNDAHGCELVNKFNCAIQTDVCNISDLIADLVKYSSLDPEEDTACIDEVKQVYRQKFISKYGVDAVESDYIQQINQLRSDNEKFENNLKTAVAVIQRAKSMQDVVRKVECIYEQNQQIMQAKIARISASKRQLENQIIQQKEKISMLKQINSQKDYENKQMLVNATGSINNDLQHYKNEYHRIITEFKSAEDLMRAQEAEISKLNILMNTSRQQMDDLIEENRKLREGLTKEVYKHLLC